MTDLTIRDVFDLPPSIPRCIVKIQDFDDEQTLQENIRDYVMTDHVATEMARLVERIVTSCERHEAGEGHYLHGSFGSGKSHFMAILGLILRNHPAIWSKDHPAIRAIQSRHGAWLTQHPVLVIPVYMLGQTNLRSALYSAANDRLKRLDLPPCDFSDADKVIAAFRADAGRYGNVVYSQFEEATGLSRTRFDRLAAGNQDERDDLARHILAFRTPGRSERTQLYPDKFSDGIAALTRHAATLGFAGVVFLIDELILFLTGKKASREYLSEFNDLAALADNSALDRALPLWVIVSKQRSIADTIPEDGSEQQIRESMDFHKDRFPETTDLSDIELVPVVQHRVLRPQPGMDAVLTEVVEATLGGLSHEVRETLLHDLTVQDFRNVYPFHPALMRTLMDVSVRLSRERTAIRLLYELLILRHPDLPVGSLVPYTSIFDLVFGEGSNISSDSLKKDELDAVRETYYGRLAPIISGAYGESEQARRAHLIVKSALLCGLSKTMRDAVTVERILHLNYQDLRGRTPFGSYQAIAQILAELDNRSELVHFTPNPANPALGVVSITLAEGAQLSDVLKRVQVNWRQRLDACVGLMKEVMECPIQNAEIPNYERIWRGSRRRGRVRFANVAALSTNDLQIANGDEFTLFVDYPFDNEAGRTRADDLQVIQRAGDRLPRIPIGFWLPAEFAPDDLRDLDEYARLLEIEGNPALYFEDYGRTQRQALESKLVGQKGSKATALRKRLDEVYRGQDASVRFLDPAITPSLDAETVGSALDRIADAVCDRLYPYHPRFATEANQRALGRLLNDFLVPAALGGGTVPRNAELDGWLTRLGEPLELAERGAANWTLRLQSRYLSKLEELAAGKRVDADKIRRGLTEAFGFNRDLSDTFLLYLTRGRGYRALRKDKPAVDVDYGGLDGLILERGERLQAHEWANVKELAKTAWQVMPAATELTVAAQDQVWRQLNAAANGARSDLQAARKRLAEALAMVNAVATTHTAERAENAEALLSPSATSAFSAVNLGAEPARLAELDAALDLNALASRSDLDPYEGLRSLLNWAPAEGSGVTRDTAVQRITQRQSTKVTLDDLATDTIGRIATLAEGGNPDAAVALAELGAFLAASSATADLTSHVASWRDRANRIIDAALRTPMIPREVVPDPKETVVKPPVREGRKPLRVTSAQVAIGGVTTALDAHALESVIGPFLEQVGAVAENSEQEIMVNIVIRQAE